LALESLRFIALQPDGYLDFIIYEILELLLAYYSGFILPHRYD
jgi:hypothetical protein